MSSRASAGRSTPELRSRCTGRSRTCGLPVNSRTPCRSATVQTVPGRGLAPRSAGSKPAILLLNEPGGGAPGNRTQPYRLRAECSALELTPLYEAGLAWPADLVPLWLSKSVTVPPEGFEPSPHRLNAGCASSYATAAYDVAGRFRKTRLARGACMVERAGIEPAVSLRDARVTAGLPSIGRPLHDQGPKTPTGRAGFAQAARRPRERVVGPQLGHDSPPEGRAP